MLLSRRPHEFNSMGNACLFYCAGDGLRGVSQIPFGSLNSLLAVFFQNSSLYNSFFCILGNVNLEEVLQPVSSV